MYVFVQYGLGGGVGGGVDPCDGGSAFDLGVGWAGGFVAAQTVVFWFSYRGMNDVVFMTYQDDEEELLGAAGECAGEWERGGGA